MHKIGFLLGVKVLTARIALEPLQCEACRRPFAEFVPEDVVTKMRWGKRIERVRVCRVLQKCSGGGESGACAHMQPESLPAPPQIR